MLFHWFVHTTNNPFRIKILEQHIEINYVIYLSVTHGLADWLCCQQQQAIWLHRSDFLTFDYNLDRTKIILNWDGFLQDGQGKNYIELMPFIVFHACRDKWCGGQLGRMDQCEARRKCEEIMEGRINKLYKNQFKNKRHYLLRYIITYFTN